MPLQATSGAASYDAFGGGVAAAPNYIEDVFQTWLYQGNGSTQTITNGIDLAGKGGLVWRQGRSAATGGMLIDTSRGVGSYLISYSTDAAQTGSNWIDSFNSNGFTMNSSSFNGGATYASWTFRKQPKFFDVVTYTGDGNSGRTIAHSLGSTPGFMIIKSTTLNNNWIIYHRSLGYQNWMILNGTSGALADSTQWVADPTSTVFTVGSGSLNNTSGQTYVAYLFAHNAGGFGLAGTDNVISCGSFTTDGAGNATVNLGYEPQWLLAKRVDTTGNWELRDSMRYWPVDDIVNGQAQLFPNLSNAESNSGLMRSPTATGFAVSSHSASATYIYIAIRRGPMKVPTSGTSVFAPAYYASGLATGTKSVTNFPVDMQIARYPDFGSSNNWVADRLRGVSSNATASGPYLMTFSTNAETTNSSLGWDNTGFLRSPNLGTFDPQVYWNFRRAPNTHDEVCYTGTGANRTVTHNLGVAPELVIVKIRSSAGDNWFVLNTSGTARLLRLNSSAEDSGGVETVFGNGSVYIAPTSTNFTVGGFGAVNQSGSTFVAYLFATCAGVSKVGGYTGNGSTQAIACGFTGGSRFVLIKAASTTGNWICVDTARGMTTSSNPVLYLNSNAAETATSGACITSTGGFTVDESKLTGVNTSGVSYIFLSYA